jgi:hypothetical protein
MLFYHFSIFSVNLYSAGSFRNSQGWRSDSASRFHENPYSGGTAPDSHRIPHQLTARATGLQRSAAAISTTTEENYPYLSNPPSLKSNFKFSSVSSVASFSPFFKKA